MPRGLAEPGQRRTSDERATRPVASRVYPRHANNVQSEAIQVRDLDATGSVPLSSSWLDLGWSRTSRFQGECEISRRFAHKSPGSSETATPCLGPAQDSVPGARRPSGGAPPGTPCRGPAARAQGCRDVG